MTWLKKHDVFTKAIAFLVALGLWFVVVNVDDIDETHTFKSIEPVFQGKDELSASKNLLIVGKYTVDIELSGKRGDLLALNQDEIKVAVDVSKITGAGTYSLPYTVTLPSDTFTLRNKKPSTLSVKIDKEDIDVVPVKVMTDGITADGYTVDAAKVNIHPTELKITGLQEEIEKISYAQAELEAKNIKTTLTEKVPYSFYDKEGNLLKSVSSISADYSSIDVIVPVLKIKDLPLTLEVAEGDDFTEYVKYTFNPKTVKVAGEEGIIDAMTSLVVGQVSISDASGETERTFELTLPDGVINMSNTNEATAKIKLDGLTTKTVKATLIELSNINTLPDGYRIKPVTTSLDVSIVGKAEDLKDIDSTNVRVIVDLKSTVLSRGTHPVKATVVIENKKDVKVVNSDSYFIQVNVQ